MPSDRSPYARPAARGPASRSRLASALPVIGLALLVAVVLPLAVPVARATSAPSSTASGTLTNISYNASTDGFKLSYGEILPTPYISSHKYPLLVYLHGEGNSTAWVSGGAGNGLTGYQTDTRPGAPTIRALVANASTFHFILIAPSPRSLQGFYTNSPCGGPQEQDTLDAIAHEQALRNISSVYLIGFSMGSIGALSLAGHHPRLFSGVAVAGTFTDAFEEFAYQPRPNSGLLALTCGARPSPTNSSVDSLFSYLSVTRFVPQNFSGMRLWAATGGKDHGAPNNLSLWGFQMVNNTFLNSTCLVASSYGEPANCTQPFAVLHTQFPTLYAYRVLYEPLGTHVITEFDPHDVFSFLSGRESGGCFTSTYPPTTLSVC